MARREDELFEQQLSEAQNPNAPSSQLEPLAAGALARFKGRDARSQKQAAKILASIAAHANTPPRLLAVLMPDFAGAFCRNPVAPFVLLEMPDFLSRLSHEGQMELLREEAAPAPLVRLLSQENGSSYDHVREAARFHVAVAGNVESQAQAEAELRAYWQNYCVRAGEKERQWHIDLAELGLAPQWAMGPEPLPEPDVPGYPKHALVEGWFRYKDAPNSPKERALLRRIGSSINDLEVLARGLRKTGTAADLIRILDVPGNDRGLVHAALLRHPAANEAVVERVASKNVPRFHRLILEHPHLPVHLLKGFLQRHDPAYRRLARQHIKAPADAVERSRNAFVNQITKDKGMHEPLFVSFIGSLHFGDLRWRSAFTHRAISDLWTQRLEAALCVPVATSELSALARDGNRYVRWAAQTRLQNPDYVFTWEGGA